MHKQVHHIEEVLTKSRLPAPCIGRLAGTNLQGDVLVEYEGHGPFPARMLSGINRKVLARHEQRGREVLLVFEKGSPERPVIIGLMEDPLEEIISFEVAEEKSAEPRHILLDGKQVTIEAEEEVLLRCGKGSIQIRKDGKIVIKGTDMLSRSSGPHRIRGASVNIN
jgi:hypothetical protein